MRLVSNCRSCRVFERASKSIGANSMFSRSCVHGPSLSAIWLIGAALVTGERLGAAAARSPTPAAPWLEVSERTACEAMQDKYCLGRYGFTIRHDGTFVAGGSGGRRAIEGKIASRELQRLGSLIRAASGAPLGREPTCRKGGLPGIRDQVDLTLASGTVVRIYDLGASVGQICSVGNRDRVLQFHDYLHRLLSRYYPVPSIAFDAAVPRTDRARQGLS
jgi:hypothetical protein